MLNPEVSAIVADLVEGALASRDRSFGMQIQAKQRSLASQGMSQGGRAVFEIAEVGNEELRTVAATLWTAFMNALRAIPPAPITRVKIDVQDAFTQMFASRYTHLKAQISSALITSGGRAQAASLDMIRNTYEALVKRYSAEIALWAAAYSASQLSVHPPGPQYVFNGPVGSVQTGAHSTANLTQTLAGADFGPLINSLDDLMNEIRRIPDCDPESQRQAVELKQDIVAALKEPQRNSFRLLGLFNGLATFVQTLAAVPAAFLEMQAIATGLGLM